MENITTSESILNGSVTALPDQDVKSLFILVTACLQELSKAPSFDASRVNNLLVFAHNSGSVELQYMTIRLMLHEYRIVGRYVDMPGFQLIANDVKLKMLFTDRTHPENALMRYVMYEGVEYDLPSITKLLLEKLR